MADSYTVMGQLPRTQLDSMGNAVTGVEITFRTKPSDVQSSILVPQSQYTPEAVKRLLEDAAANIEAIHAL